MAIANAVLLFLPPLLLLSYCVTGTFAAYPPNFHNVSGCLYSYVAAVQYQVLLPEANPMIETFNKVTYDPMSTCIANNGKDTHSVGKLVMNFDPNPNYFSSMSLEFGFKLLPSDGYWQIDKVTLHIDPVNKNLLPEKTIALRPSTGTAFGNDHQSYSCSSFVLHNSQLRKGDPFFTVTLKRFQVQPFGELPSTVFARSRDCSLWLTLPQIMGILLMLLILLVALFGIQQLYELGDQSSDLKFNKQGGMLMNQAQLDATKAD